MVEMLKFSGPILIAHGLVFGALVFAARRLIMRSARRAVGAVRQVESDLRAKEAAILRQIEEHDKEFARRQAEAAEEIDRRRRQSETEIEQAREKAVEDAKIESRRIVERARQSEENMRRRLTQETEERAMGQAQRMLEMIFSDKVVAALHASLLDELFEALEEMETGGITVEADEAEVRVAHPLDDGRRGRLQTLLKSKFGIDARISENVDAGLLGGLAFKLGSLEIDGSLRNRLREAQAEIGKEA